MIAALATAGALYGGFRYSGHPVCPAAATVSLVSAVVYPGDDSHVAAWVGASSLDGQTWVQAGVAEAPDGEPRAYLERATAAGAYSLVDLGPAASVDVRLTRHGRHGETWRVDAGGKHTSVKLSHVRCFSGLESEDWARRNAAVAEVTISGTTFRVGL